MSATALTRLSPKSKSLVGFVVALPEVTVVTGSFSYEAQ